MSLDHRDKEQNRSELGLEQSWVSETNREYSADVFKFLANPEIFPNFSWVQVVLASEIRQEQSHIICWLFAGPMFEGTYVEEGITS